MPVTRIDDVRVWTGVPVPGTATWGTSDAIAFDATGILALGDAARRLPADVVVDGDGGFACAAFADGHVHPMVGGRQQVLAPVHDATTPQEAAAAVGRWAADHPDVPWVRGEGYDPTIAPGGVFHAAWLDAHVPDRPVFLRASDFHTAWVNSEALRRAGYDATTPQPVGGDIVRDEAGAPVGTLREWGAWKPVLDLAPPTTTQEAASALAAATTGLAAAGLAWVQDAWVEPTDVDGWLAAAAEDDLAVRADLALLCDPDSWRDQLDAFAYARTRVTDGGRGRLSAHTVKFFADGVIEAGTGALLAPYCDCPHSTGMPNWEPSELAEAVSAVVALGFAPHLHAIGDAAARIALDAVEASLAANGAPSRPATIAHAQLVDAADLGRFAQLGVVANFEPYWARLDASQVELTAPRLGPERAAQQYRIRTLLASGAAVSFGSDWPVSTFRPLDGIQVAVTRQLDPPDPGPAWMPEEQITVEQALAAYTSGVAHQSGDPHAGVLRTGSRADVVLLADDPREVPPLEIAAIEVRGTWCDGVRTHGG